MPYLGAKDLTKDFDLCYYINAGNFHDDADEPSRQDTAECGRLAGIMKFLTLHTKML